ncbi:hypothetical protein A176_005391 [Myxococcus hansupus]|uniref:Uncharacterized protein n=1 Tax=Pseudomyxococcus hansupus TaxID=1297742 RepID=A0A0H4X064_9BACT|nr:hypothetical protein A176_005391 [Myxococcus hansupus]
MHVKALDTRNRASLFQNPPSAWRRARHAGRLRRGQPESLAWVWTEGGPPLSRPCFQRRPKGLHRRLAGRAARRRHRRRHRWRFRGADCRDREGPRTPPR